MFSDIFFLINVRTRRHMGNEGCKNENNKKYDNQKLFFKPLTFQRALIRLCDSSETFHFSYFKIVNFVQYQYKRFIEK